MQCVWCNDPEADETDIGPDSYLCRAHEAEYEGTSLTGLDRRDAEQYADTL